MLKHATTHALALAMWCTLQAVSHATAWIDPFSSTRTTNGSTNPLHAHPWYEYQLVGTFIEHRQTWALVRSPTTHWWRLTVGDQLGSDPYEIIQIDLASMLLKPVDHAQPCVRLTLGEHP